MKNLFIVFFTVVFIPAFAQSASQVHLSCNNGEFQIMRKVEKAEGEALYTSYQVTYKGELVASDLQGDAIDIKEIDPEDSFSVFNTKDYTTFVQIGGSNRSGQAYMKVPEEVINSGRIYKMRVRKIIPLSNCLYL